MKRCLAVSSLKIFYDIVSARRPQDILTASSTTTMGAFVPSSRRWPHVISSRFQSVEGMSGPERESGVTDGPAGGLRCQGAPKINKWENKERKKKRWRDRNTEEERERKQEGQDLHLRTFAALNHIGVTQSYLIYFISFSSRLYNIAHYYWDLDAARKIK